MPTCIGHLEVSRVHWYHFSTEDFAAFFFCQLPIGFKSKQIGSDGIVCSEQMGTVIFFHRDFQTSIGKSIHIARERGRGESPAAWEDLRHVVEDAFIGAPCAPRKLLWLTSCGLHFSLVVFLHHHKLPGSIFSNKCVIANFHQDWFRCSEPARN